MKNTNLWWQYNSESESFSPLPTGPLFWPALLVVLAIGLKNKSKQTRNKIDQGFIKSEYYNKKKQRYNQLISKSIYHPDGLSIPEAEELRTLESPAWARGTEWFY